MLLPWPYLAEVLFCSEQVFFSCFEHWHNLLWNTTLYIFVNSSKDAEFCNSAKQNFPNSFNFLEKFMVVSICLIIHIHSIFAQLYNQSGCRWCPFQQLWRCFTIFPELNTSRKELINGHEKSTSIRTGWTILQPILMQASFTLQGKYVRLIVVSEFVIISATGIESVLRDQNI